MAPIYATQSVDFRADISGSDGSGCVPAEPSGSLSVNIFWEHKKGLCLCKTNCRSIEVPLHYPSSHLESSQVYSLESGQGDCETWSARMEEEEQRKEALERPVGEMEGMLADQEHPEIISLTANRRRSRVSSSSASSPLKSSSSTASQPFQFLNLPLELRLKIYGYLLPARHHTIVTQLPHNGSFYNTAPAYSAQSFYHPFGWSPPFGSQNTLTTYKVLSSNSHRSYPYESIHPAIFRASQQIREEAETVLYGNRESVWDFGVHLDACRAFWGDRSPGARRAVRGLRIAKEVPCLEDGEEGGRDEKWVEFCKFLTSEMGGLRTLDLTIWGSGGSVARLPGTGVGDAVASLSVDEDWMEEEAGSERKKEEEREWRDWEWIFELLQGDALRTAKITWWGFGNLSTDGSNGEGAFDSWLARRMVGDRLVRDRMVREGVVIEGVVLLSGKWT